ncbi:hypothetical protein DFH06DRAFT_1344050 [Mycena polygramma]|nr:hypothetical protein DFH06DRAFT_1344050 [Mycena polygramma]
MDETDDALAGDMPTDASARHTRRLVFLRRPGDHSTLPIPHHTEIATGRPVSRKERQRMWARARRPPLEPHETVDWIQSKLLRRRGKKPTKKRVRALLRLRELRAREDAGSTHESDASDASRTTEDLVDEADWREVVGKEWRLTETRASGFFFMATNKQRAKATAARAPRTAPGPGKGPANKRSRKKGTGKKPGKESWVHGTKLKFLTKFVDDWRAAHEQGVVFLGRFYTKVTNLYLLKYGYFLKDDEDLVEDTEDPVDPNARIPGSESLTSEEAEFRSDYTLVLRKRIAAWYCRTYRDVSESEKNFFADILGGMDGAGPGHPKRAQLIHYYSRRWYEERVKARFEAAFMVEKQLAKDLGKEEPSEIKVRNEITREVFEEETEEFQEELKRGVEAEYTAAVRAWELTRGETQTRTPAELNAALKSAGFYLEPLAEAIKEKFGLNCTILLCGPMGDRGGAIEVRSVHAGTTKGMTPRKWHEFDRMGYADVEKCMVNFSQRCFSEEDCLSRTEGVQQAGGGVASSAPLPAAGIAPGTQFSAGTRPEASGAASEENTNANANASANANANVNGNADRNGAATASGIANTNGTGTVHNTGQPRPDSSGAVEPSPNDGGGGAAPEEDAPPAEPTHEVWARKDRPLWGVEISKAMAAFSSTTQKWGDNWAECVVAWLDFEGGTGYGHGGRLGNEQRPVEVKNFINGGRKWYAPPVISKVGKKDEAGSYAAQWWGWWDGFQPGDDEGEWGDLPLMHGPTGLMLVLAALFWWGLAEEGNERGEEWEGAVTALKELLRGLVDSGELVDNYSEGRKKVQKKMDRIRGTSQPKRKRGGGGEADEEAGVSKKRKVVATEGGKRVTRTQAAKDKENASGPRARTRARR